MSKNVWTGIGVLFICIVSLGLGYMLVAKPAAPKPGESAVREAVVREALESRRLSATAVVVAPEDENQKFRRALEDLSSPTWTEALNGCQTVRDKNELHIQGVQDKQGWVNNGITSSVVLPEGDFTISVDVKLLKPTQSGWNRNAYVRVVAANQSAIGVFSNDSALYSVQNWQNPQVHSYTTSHFNGNNATDYHRLKLSWDNAAQTASAWVDEKKIGSINTTLGARRRLMLFANCDTKGAEFDFYFKNLAVELP